MKIVVLPCALAVEVWSSAAGAASSSYPVAAVDEVGVTGAQGAATCVADYAFVSNLGLGFGGTNANVFDVGAYPVLSFPSPLRNISTQYDFIVYAFLGVVQSLDYDADVENAIGSLYEKTLYFSTTPALSGNHPVDFYEFVSTAPPPSPVPFPFESCRLGFGLLRNRCRLFDGAQAPCPSLNPIPP